MDVCDVCSVKESQGSTDSVYLCTEKWKLLGSVPENENDHENENENDGSLFMI